MDMINDLVPPDGPNAKTYAACGRSGACIEDTVAAIAEGAGAGAPSAMSASASRPTIANARPASPLFSQGATRIRDVQARHRGTEVHALSFAPRPATSTSSSIASARSTRPQPRADPARQRRRAASSCRGVSTNGVVHAGGREGHDRDYACVVLEDCCCRRHRRTA